MSEPATPLRPFYVTGGTLKPGEPSYVERRADTELFESLLAGDLCYVLTPRQMGKSSLMAKTAARLGEAGVASAIVDLTQIGSERGAQASAQWYFGIANEIHRRLGIAVPLRSWWQERADLPPVQRLTEFFRDLVLTHCPGRVVIFVDEIDSTIGLPFADDFFAALRACFNARATEPAFERLTFVLLGVATPDQLIQDSTRTPFNIGRRVDLTDFNPDEARKLALGLHADPGEAGRRLERILHWTGGHPYLTQALCRAVREREVTGTTEKAVDLQVQELFLTSQAQREETNLKHARARLERRGREGRLLLQLYRRVHQGKSVLDQPTSPLFAQLKLIGIVKATDEGLLAVRNRIYEAVFTLEWLKSAMPVNRSRQLAAAILTFFLIWYAAMQPRLSEQAFLAAIEDDGYNSAIQAYRVLRTNPFYRSRADDLMQQFWEQRALRFAQIGRRDESLLSCLQGLILRDNERLRRKAQNLVGLDYERLQLTLWHVSNVIDVAFSPDGRTLATGSGNAVQLWDARFGKPLMPPLQHENSVAAITFSPDGRTLAVGVDEYPKSQGPTIQLWDTRSGKPIMPPLQHERGRLHALAFSPDGRTFATGSHDFSGQEKSIVRLWDAHSGRPLAPPLMQEDSVFYSLAFSPDSRTFATGSSDLELEAKGSIRFWDARTGSPLKVQPEHQGAVYDLAFSPDGRILATGHLGGTTFSDAHTGELLQHVGIESFILAWPNNQRSVVWSFGYKAALLLEVSTGKPLARSLPYEELPTTLTFSPAGNTLATGAREAARLWHLPTMNAPETTLQYQVTGTILAFSPDGQMLATQPKGNIVRLWEASTGSPLAFPLQHPDLVYAVAFSPDGRTLATRSGNTVHLWEVHTGKPLVPPLQHPSDVYAMAFSPDGRTLATSFSAGTRLWDMATGKPIAPRLQHENVRAVSFSPNGRILATGSFSTARLWDARTGKPLVPPLQYGDSVDILAFSPNGRTLATGSWQGIAQLWDVHTGAPLTRRWNIQDEVQTIAFKPDGKGLFVATANWLNTYSWDGKEAVLQSSQLLHGIWQEWFQFPSDCKNCLQVALGDTLSSFHLETLHLDGPIDPPIEGDPKELLEKWKARLALKFDDQMKPVPQ